MKYLTNFKTKEEYEAFKAGDSYLTPNVSFIETAGSVINDSYQVQGGGSASTMEYFLADDMMELGGFASVLKLYYEDEGFTRIIPACPWGAEEYQNSILVAVGLDLQSEFIGPEPFSGKLIDIFVKMGLSEEAIASIPRITKEEFYNLNA